MLGLLARRGLEAVGPGSGRAPHAAAPSPAHEPPPRPETEDRAACGGMPARAAAHAEPEP